VEHDWDGSDRRDVQRWRIKKEISVGDLVAIITAATAIMYAYTTLDKRVTVIETVITAQRDTDTRQDNERQRLFGQLEAGLREINRKLDSIIIADRAAAPAKSR